MKSGGRVLKTVSGGSLPRAGGARGGTSRRGIGPGGTPQPAGPSRSQFDKVLNYLAGDGMLYAPEMVVHSTNREGVQSSAETTIRQKQVTARFGIGGYLQFTPEGTVTQNLCGVFTCAGHFDWSSNLPNLVTSVEVPADPQEYASLEAALAAKALPDEDDLEVCTILVRALAGNDFVGGTSKLVVPGTIVTQHNDGAAIPAGPFQIAVDHAATFVADLGVIGQDNVTPLAKVVGVPAAGQYAEAAGVYTFAAADTGLVVHISYTFSYPNDGTGVAAFQIIDGPVKEVPTAS